MAMGPEEEEILAEQLAYYRARAPEYEEWFLRLGRYDRGDEHRQAWFGEVEMLEAALDQAAPSGDVLELACGTGIWTRRLVTSARHLTALDASPEALALNRSRLGGGNVTYVEADLFRWTPPATYDFVFFGFWLSHVPEAQFEAFWRLVRAAVRPSGKVFFVDSQPAPEGTALDQGLGTDGLVERHLNDGRTFRVVKVFHEPGGLKARLERLGWSAEVQPTPSFFMYGSASPR
jgi:SAM-dependent methyltransferase